MYDKVLSYASRKLQVHERNYAAFLLEIQATVWAMNHFTPISEADTYSDDQSQASGYLVKN